MPLNVKICCEGDQTKLETLFLTCWAAQLYSAVSTQQSLCSLHGLDSLKLSSSGPAD